MHRTEKKKDKYQIRMKPKAVHPAALENAGEYLQQFKRAGLMDDYNAERGR